MINDPENRLIEALKNVDAHGDVAPPQVHDPMTMVLTPDTPGQSYRPSQKSSRPITRC
jgi:hypothetical protein